MMSMEEAINELTMDNKSEQATQEIGTPLGQLCCFKPNIYAKSALTREQMDVKCAIGCDGLEIQLLGELIEDRSIGKYRRPECLLISILVDYMLWLEMFLCRI